MSDFDELLALTHAAESCNGAARHFAEQYSRVPEWSHFQNGTLCQPTADSQAAGHLGFIRSDADKLRDYIREWDAAYGGLSYIKEAIASLATWPIFNVNGKTHSTAHEAARGFAEWIVEVWGQAEGWNDMEIINDIAKRLGEISPLQDFAGYIEREHFAASPLAPDAGNADSQSQTECDDVEMNDGRTYLTTELCSDFGDINSATLAKYVKLTDVRRSRRGERDRRYTSHERMQIAKAIAGNAPADSAGKARQILVEIESKSKARK